MRHGKAGKKLGRRTSQRVALFRNLATSVIQYEQVTTTLVKAKLMRAKVDQLITLAKRGDLHARRQAMVILRDRALLDKLFNILAIRYEDRPGGYTRVIKAGFRYGDNAPLAVLELVDRDPTAKPKQEKKIETEEGDAAAA